MTTTQYINWITENKELTKNATLFMTLHTEKKYYKRAQGPDTKVLFPPGIIDGDSLPWGEVQSSLAQFAKPYIALMEKAKQLPALGTRGMAYYDLCDQMWKLGEQLPIHEGMGYDRGYRGRDRVPDELTLFPAQRPRSSLSNILYAMYLVILITPSTMISIVHFGILFSHSVLFVSYHMM